MRARIHITLKKGVLDPQGKAVENALASLGFDGIRNARVGKYIELDLAVDTLHAAEQRVGEMCERLLANPVIENYRVTLDRPD